ncbi:MAG: hypothetical protein Q9160_001345 [Pyrenula sp. 1 TL-2023]
MFPILSPSHIFKGFSPSQGSRLIVRHRAKPSEDKKGVNSYAYQSKEDLEKYLKGVLSPVENLQWLPELVKFDVGHQAICWPFEVLAHLFLSKFRIKEIEIPFKNVPKQEDLDWLRAVLNIDPQLSALGMVFDIREDVFKGFFANPDQEEIKQAWREFEQAGKQLRKMAYDTFCYHLVGGSRLGDKAVEQGQALVDEAKKKYSKEDLQKYEVQKHLGDRLEKIWYTIPEEKLAPPPPAAIPTRILRRGEKP